MEENLLAKQREKQKVTWDGLGEEMKRIICIAVPMVIVTATQYLLQVVSIMMVGHLNNNLYLSGAALAISLATVTGFSVLAGMASGLETICGQAYGAQQYEKVGVQTYTAIFSLTVVCLPLTFIWISMEKILVFIGQDPLIAQEAGKFLIWLVPALFAHAIMQPFVRYFQMQSLLLPMLISSCVTLCIHIPLCWALVFQTGMNNIGGALAMSISIWLNVTFLGLYMRYSPACAKTRAPISMELFQGIWEFFRFAIPSAVMICLEWWSFELLILLSGLLPNPQLETSVLSICLNTISTLFSIPFGIAAAASTRISNELGAGNPHAAHVAVLAAMSFAIMETAIVSGTLFVCRHDFGYIFSNEKEVVDYVTVMAPLICISVILDSIQGVLAGVARGCGWQHIGVYVNLGAFYLCGIPVAATLAFLAKMRGKGLWIGVQVGAFVQCILFSTITSCINWEQQAIKARKRLFDSEISADNRLCLKFFSQSWAIKARKRLFDSEFPADNRLKHEQERVTWGVYSEEMRRVCHIAGPMVAVVSSQYLLQVVSTMIVGHLGELYLSSAALAISLSGVTGFSLLMGMASGLETICGQAYGGQQYQRIGIQTYTAIFSLILVSIPVSLLWINMETILVFIGQDPLISHEAGKFTIWLVPALFAYAILQPLVRYFQIQSLLLPMFASSCVTLIIHVPLCWALVFKTSLSNVGGALAVSISIWSNVIFLVLYMRYSSACAKTRAPISMELFKGMWEFFRFAIPSAVMDSYQIHNLKLQFCPLNTIATLYTIPFGIGAAASTRVSNELGAGNSHAARVAVLAAMSLAVIETSIVSATLFACRNVFGYIFSNEKEVVDYVTAMAPLVCISVILDSIQGVLTGIARGCGWQHLGVYVNLGAFYLCGIPMAALLAFLVRLGGKGLWIGIQSGAFVQCILLSIITGCINWEKQAIKARKRLFDEKISADNILIISMVMVGHLGKLALSSTAIAISLCAVSGFSLIFAMSCALETQCGQAYGAHQYRKFGVQMYTAIVSLTLACLPLSPLWVYLGKILIFLGQDPLISQEAGKFALCMTPALFDYATLQALVRYFLMQSLTPNEKTCISHLFNLSVTTTIYTIPEAIGSAASTRVSNALGGGSPQLAQVSVSAAMTLAASAAILVSSIIFACRQVVGYAFSNELDVVDYFTEMVPLLSISVILDTLHDTLSGIARGCGWQHRGAYVNLDAYYVVGIPIAAILGFCLQLRGKGLWIGILTGAFCQTVMVSLITSCTNWEKQAIKAWERIFQRNFAVEDGLVLANGEDSLNLSASFVGIGKSFSFGGRKDQILELEEEKVLMTRHL
ncbi:Protein DETOXIFICATION 12 [Glycine max]|nr:Protein DETOXIFICATION 12 [Glycine max]